MNNSLVGFFLLIPRTKVDTLFPNTPNPIPYFPYTLFPYTLFFLIPLYPISSPPPTTALFSFFLSEVFVRSNKS